MNKNKMHVGADPVSAHTSKTRQNKGITLIALIITIIVMLILVAVTINMAVNGGLFEKAKEGIEETIMGQEKEQVQLAYSYATIDKLGDKVTDEDLQKELDKSVGNGKTYVEDNGDDTLNVLFIETNHGYTVDNGTVRKAVSSQIKTANVVTYGINQNVNYITILYNSGTLVRSDYGSYAHGGYIEYDCGTSTLISEDVKEYRDEVRCDYYYNQYTSLGGYYLRNDNNLYYYDGTDSILVGEDVCKYTQFYIGGSRYLYYITNDNELYSYNYSENTSNLFGENVKNVYIDYENNIAAAIYLTYDKELFCEGGTLIANNVKDVVNYHKNHRYMYIKYLLDDGSVYEFGGVAQKVVGTDGSYTYRLFADNVKGEGAKEISAHYYIDRDNNLYISDEYSNWEDIELVGTKIKYYKEYSDYSCIFLDNQNDLNYFEPGETAKKVNIDSDVKEVKDRYYVNYNDNLYFINNPSTASKSLKAENVVEFYEDGAYFKNDGSFVSSDEIEISNVKKYIPEKSQIITNEGKFYLDGETIVEVVNSGSNWYEGIDGKICYYVEGYNDIAW